MDRISRPKLVIFSVVWTLLIFFLFWWVNYRENEHIHRSHIVQAETLFQQVVDIRTWNSSHGGVYVKVDDKTQPNPYLGVAHRDIVTEDGQVYTLINPAFMTRQLAEIGEKKNRYKIHITSLTPLRPENKPSKREEMGRVKSTVSI